MVLMSLPIQTILCFYDSMDESFRNITMPNLMSSFLAEVERNVYESKEFSYKTAETQSK